VITVFLCDVSISVIFVCCCIKLINQTVDAQTACFPSFNIIKEFFRLTRPLSIFTISGLLCRGLIGISPNVSVLLAGTIISGQVSINLRRNETSQRKTVFFSITTQFYTDSHSVDNPYQWKSPLIQNRKN